MKVQKNGEDGAWVNKNNMNMQIEGCIVNTPREKLTRIWPELNPFSPPSLEQEKGDGGMSSAFSNAPYLTRIIFRTIW